MIDLALYLGSLFCKKLNPVSGLLQTPTFFFPKMVLYLAPSMFPSTLAVFPVPDEERQPQTMHDAATTPFDSGGCSQGDMLCYFYTKHNVMRFDQTVKFWFHPTRAPSSTFDVANFKREFLCFSLKNGFLLATLSYRSFIQTDSPTLAVDLCSSPQVNIGFSAASLSNALLVWAESLEECPCLGRFAVVSSSLHLKMIY